MNILSLLQFSLVFIPLCPNFVVLFLPQFLSNRLQTLAQGTLGIENDCFDFLRDRDSLNGLNPDFSVFKEK